MGLFGGKKTYVSSVVYNMAGDVAGRPNYLKTVIAGSTLVDDSRSKAELIGSSYINGRGIKLRSFYRWALDNYDAIGVPKAKLYGAVSITPADVEASITKPPGSTAIIQSVEYGVADFAYWAEQWMFANHPTLIETAWSADYIDATGKIRVTFADTTTAEFTPADFDKTADYIYAVYILDLGVSSGATVPGTEVFLAPIETYPSLTGWTNKLLTLVPTTEILETITTTTVTYSDGRPAEVTKTATTTTESYNRMDSSYTQTVYQGEHISLSGGYDQLKALDKTMYQRLSATKVTNTVTTPTTVDIGGGVTKTTTVAVQTETLSYSRSYRIDTVERLVKNWTPAQTFIYRVGSGDTRLDDLVTQGSSAVSGTGTQDGYLPFIPVRINNAFLSTTNNPTAYAAAKKAYGKIVGGKFDDLVDALSDNSSLGDIDYAYVMFGATLNTKDQSTRKYIYMFFDRLRKSTINNNDLSEYETNQALAINNSAALVAWRLAQKIPTSGAYGTEAPYFAGASGVPVKEVRIQSTGTALNSNVDFRISWNSITKETGTGLLKPGAKAGEVWFQEAGTTSIDNAVISVARVIASASTNIQKIELCWQIDATHWKKLTVSGLIHRNYIYDGKYVETDVHTALADADESDFIIPIHYNTLKEMTLVDSTQMAGECAFIVFNSYKVVKQKWYQTGIFKIILAVVVVAVIFFTGGIGAGTVGLLGTNAAVGAAIGLTGVAAIIAGAAINALAAMLLVKLIQIGSVELFGEQVGIIIGTIAGVIAVGVGTGMMNGQSFSTIMANMTRADNLISLTSSAGNAVSQSIAASAQATAMKTQELLEDYNRESAALSELYAKNLGYDNGVFDPMNLTNSPSLMIESSTSFLQRTLMTGSDIAGLSMEMIYQFADLTLATKLPG